MTYTEELADAIRHMHGAKAWHPRSFAGRTLFRAGLGRQSGIPNLRARRSPDKAHIAYIGGRGVVGKYSGIETYYEETGKRLVKSGHQITIYCRNHFTPKTGVREGVCIWRLPTIRTKHSDTFTLADQHRACEFSDYDVFTITRSGLPCFR